MHYSGLLPRIVELQESAAQATSSFNTYAVPFLGRSVWPRRRVGQLRTTRCCESTTKVDNAMAALLPRLMQLAVLDHGYA